MAGYLIIGSMTSGKTQTINRMTNRSQTLFIYKENAQRDYIAYTDPPEDPENPNTPPHMISLEEIFRGGDNAEEVLVGKPADLKHVVFPDLIIIEGEIADHTNDVLTKLERINTVWDALVELIDGFQKKGLIPILQANPLFHDGKRVKLVSMAMNKFQASWNLIQLKAMCQYSICSETAGVRPLLKDPLNKMLVIGKEKYALACLAHADKDMVETNILNLKWQVWHGENTPLLKAYAAKIGPGEDKIIAGGLGYAMLISALGHDKDKTLLARALIYFPETHPVMAKEWIPLDYHKRHTIEDEIDEDCSGCHSTSVALQNLIPPYYSFTIRRDVIWAAFGQGNE